jgi:hypothetical protein
MERQEMIKKIYEVIADKTLSFGCKIRPNDDNFQKVCLFIKDDTYLIPDIKCLDQIPR